MLVIKIGQLNRLKLSKLLKEYHGKLDYSKSKVHMYSQIWSTTLGALGNGHTLPMYLLINLVEETDIN